MLLCTSDWASTQYCHTYNFTFKFVFHTTWGAMYSAATVTTANFGIRHCLAVWGTVGKCDTVSTFAMVHQTAKQ